ncbi:hypothetical protein QJQ45_004783 [Haematococcus lacustris]|nr:hypothetical protein QJQ45_004783 [Haematococcus lacustris]
MRWASPPRVTQAVSAASGVADQLCRWELTKGQLRQASGLNNARCDTQRWLAPIQPHLKHLAAASSAGTSLEASLKHITTTLATWDAVWEVYLDSKQGVTWPVAHAGAITTLGRGGSDLTATVLGAALQLPEVQVWKDVDGVLTSDPRLVPHTRPVTELTFEEATELAYFGAQVLHPQAMQPAIRSGTMGVRVKNSYNRTAAGTFITAQRDMSKVLVTSIVLKLNVTLVDIISTRMMGQSGFLATVFEAFRVHKLSVDVVATSEAAYPVRTPWWERRAGGSDFRTDRWQAVREREYRGQVSQAESKALRTVLGVELKL